MEAAQQDFSRIALLYAEDDQVTRNVLTLIFARKFPGMQLHVAENGRAGLELFRKHTPAIVITDINMPELDGIQMAREIKAIHPDTVIIVISAYSDTHYLMNAIEIGISHYIMKPIDHKKLFSVMEKSIARITLERQCRAQELEIKRLATFPQLNPNPVIELDMTGKITYSNEAAEKAVREIADSNDVALFLPADMAEMVRMFEEGNVTACYREVTIGEAVYGENIYFAPQFTTMRIYATDITARKRLEAGSPQRSNNVTV